MDIIVSQLVIIFVLIIVSSYFVRSSSKLEGHYRLFYGISGMGYIITISLGLTSELISIDYSLIYSHILEWFRIISVVTMLCGLGVKVRYAKPKIIRAPIILSFLPVLLLFVHPFVQDTLLLKDVLINFYHGGGLLIALMMYTIKAQRVKGYLRVLSGVIVILLGYTLNFFDWNVVSVSNSVISGGLYLVYNGYKKL
jgi:hypothetical protein